MTSTEQQTTRLDATMVRTWFDVLYVNTPGLIHISSTGNWAGRAFTNYDQAADHVAHLDAGQPEGIYLRATTLKGQPGKGGRGGAADSLALPGLWGDLDIAGPGHKTTEQLPPDEQAARQIITNSGLPDPTLWVHSGGGLYPWWLLDQHADVTEDNLAQLEQLSARWQAIIGRSATALGWHYGTGVGDLARVLRIPGTINRKEGLERPCRIIDAQPGRYTLDQLHTGLAAALERHPNPTPTPVPAPRRLEVVRPAGHITPNDDFEQRTSWDDQLLLGGAGWRIASGQPGSYCEWVRPGKTTAGISATTGKDTARDRLYVFSEDAGLPVQQSITKPHLYALLHHNGDDKAATKELARLGYGTPLERVDPAAEQRAAFADLLPPATAARVLAAVDGTSARVLAEPTPGPDRFGPTEAGMARALVANHGDAIRYCPQRGKWLTWDGHRWDWDDAEQHRELILALADRMPNDKEWGQFHRRAMSSAGVTGIARLAQHNQRVVAHFDDLDSNAWEINTPGGIVDLRTGTVRDPDPAALHTRSTSCPVDLAADTGRWLEFLADTFGDNPELISYLRRLVGYSAVGLVGPHVLPFCHGSGGNGKGVFLEALAGVLGDYATTAPVGFLMAQAHAGHETEIARLAGARMVICSEVNEDDRFDEAKVKMLTGGDSLTARFMRQDHFTFTPTHQLWLMGNHQPAVRSGGRSFWRRLRLIPFEHEVPEEKIVDDLQGILVRDHGPALLAWIVAGAAQYHATGLQEPDSVKAATAEYAHDQDSVAKFVQECCHVGGGKQVTIKTAKVREAYEQFCYGEGETPVSPKALGIALEKRFGVLRLRTPAARMYGNLSLLVDENASSDASSTRDEQGGW